jgi:hypothetical protein
MLRRGPEALCHTKSFNSSSTEGSEIFIRTIKLEEIKQLS